MSDQEMNTPEMTQPQPTFRRRKKLIKPGLQLKATFVFLGTSCIGIIVQTIVLFSTLTKVASEVPNDSLYVMSVIPRMVTTSLLVTFALLVPLTLAVGILITFKIAGPIYRMEQFMKQIISGEKPGDCSLRDGDQLHDFCALLNQATASARCEDEAVQVSSERQARPAA
jgi:hypothetical protein